MLHHGKNWISGTNRIIAYLSKTACVTKETVTDEREQRDRSETETNQRRAPFFLFPFWFFFSFSIQQGYNANEHLSTEEVAKSVAYGSLIDESLTDALVNTTEWPERLLCLCFQCWMGPQEHGGLGLTVLFLFFFLP